MKNYLIILLSSFIFTSCVQKEKTAAINNGIDSQLSELRNNNNILILENKKLEAKIANLQDTINILRTRDLEPYVSGHNNSIFLMNDQDVEVFSSAFMSVSDDFVESILPIMKKYKDDTLGRYAFCLLFSKGLVSPLTWADFSWYDEKNYVIRCPDINRYEEEIKHIKVYSRLICNKMMMYQKELQLKAIANKYGETYVIDPEIFN